MNKAIYLGDGVYAIFDGHRIVLRIGSHDNKKGQIYLELNTFNSLIEFGNFHFKLKK